MRKIEIKFILEVEATTLDINSGKITKSTESEIIGTMLKSLEPSRFVYNSNYDSSQKLTTVVVASKMAQTVISKEY